MDIFTISGQPRGKARPRFGNGHAYTPEKTRTYEDLVGWEFKRQVNKFYEGAIYMRIFAFYPIPKSASKATKEKMIEGSIRPCVKIDADNCAKTLMDSLNGTAYKDDAQIVELCVYKYYSETPCVKVRVGEVEKTL